MVVILIMVDSFISVFNCTTVGRSLDQMTAPSAICFNVCSRAHRGPVCGFRVLIATEPFHHSDFDYMYFTVV